jgi:4-amino-4-deoxy-L-arabinose transferase-like glycosyltransferase
MLAAPEKERVRPGTYVLVFAASAAILFILHAAWLTLPYFWDEAGYYVPAALDVYHHGAIIPTSVPPTVHPPGVPTYLAVLWRIVGFHHAATRGAMLLIAALGLAASFLLAIELSKEARGFPAIFAAMLLCVSPLFVSQAILAQLDMPAMAFTTCALLLFLQDRVRLAAAVCVALVLSKETGVLAPALFGLWLAKERRWRDAAWFAAPLAVLGAWMILLWWKTGHWSGSTGFLNYNVAYPLHPFRLAADLGRRLYYVGFANLHWLGLIAIALAWRNSKLFRSREWRVAGALALGHIALVTLLGGAVLERYVLPSLPIVYAAMAAALSLLPRAPRLALSGALLAGVGAANFINPPYPFPYENNVTFASFAQAQHDAAETLDLSYSGAHITTAWPLSIELTRPELGFVRAPYPAPEELADFSAETIRRLDWRKVQVLVVFSRDWDPGHSLLHIPTLDRVWRKYFGYAPPASPAELDSLIPFPLLQEVHRGSQWAFVYVNPAILPFRPSRLANVR